MRAHRPSYWGSTPLIAAVLLVAIAGVAAAQQTALRIGTSSSGSIYYALAVGLSKILGSHAGISATAEPVGGSSANIFALDADKVDIAITNSASAYDGYHAVAPFKKQIKTGLIAQGQPSYRQIIVRTGSGITKPEDLAGKTLIGKRPALPEIEQITNALLKVYNLEGKVRIVSTTETNEAVNAIQSGTVDAVLIPASMGASYIQTLAHDRKISFLQIPEDKIKAMQQILPKSLSAGMLPAKSYENQDQSVRVFVLATYLVGADRLSEENGYKVTKALFDNLTEFHGLHNEAKDWTVAQTLNEPKIPYHPGAVRYFREKNIWTPALDALQKELSAQ